MISLAQFGLGGLGMVELDALRDTERVDIVAGADPAPGPREHFETEYGGEAYVEVEELLAAHADELDAVNVVSPHTLHFEQTMAALDHDLAVHLEKPMVTDLGDAVELTERVREEDHLLQVGYQRHFDPAYERLRGVLREGAVGEVQAANCFLEQEWIGPQSQTWRTDPSLSGGGQLFDSGSHLLDALLWTTGATPKSASAVIESNGHPVDVHSSLSVALDRGGDVLPASVFVTGDGPTGPDTREGLYLWCDEGSVEYSAVGIEIRHPDGTIERPEVEEPDFVELTRRKLAGFLDALEGTAENRVPSETGLQVVALTQAAYRASEERETVDVQAMLDEAGSD